MERGVYLKRGDCEPYIQLEDVVVTKEPGGSVAIYEKEEFEALIKWITEKLPRASAPAILRIYSGYACDIECTEECQDIVIPLVHCTYAGLDTEEEAYIWTIGTGKKLFLSKSEESMRKSVEIQMKLHGEKVETLQFATCRLYS